jgi:hypothetical protein
MKMVILLTHKRTKSKSFSDAFQASAAPRPENSDSDEKDALFGLDAQITILIHIRLRALVVLHLTISFRKL